MHYFQFNIGDYASHTRHLTRDEDLIYRRLLDLYYLQEKPLPADPEKCARLILMSDCSADVERVLNEFFEPSEGGMINKRADAEIAKYHGKSQKAREAGKASAQARRERTLNVCLTDAQLNKKQEPINKKQENIKDKVRAPDGVSESVWESFLEQRKKARAVVTDTVLKSIVSEAKKAGWTVEQAMTEMVVRGWRGFKADWVAGKGVIEKPVRWNSTVDGIMEKGKELGITHRQGETIGQYEERIREAIPGPASLARQ